MDETIAQLTELLQAYRDNHFRGTDIDEHELSDLKDRAKVAQDTFQAMFRGRLEDESFLTQWSEADVMRTFRLWVVGAGHSSSGRQAYNSLEDCSTQLMHLTSEQNWTEEPAKWPYIRKVKSVLLSIILPSFCSPFQGFLKCSYLKQRPCTCGSTWYDIQLSQVKSW
jgi:hypothetical protein